MKFLLIFVIIPFTLFANEKKTIFWLDTGFAPLHIDDNRGPIGFGDQIQDELIKCLPKYKHIVKRNTPIKRLFRALHDKTKNNCAPGHAIEPKQLSEVLFSDILLYIDSPVVLIRNDKLKQIRKLNSKFISDSISLDLLLGATKLRPGSIGGSFHGEKIDKIVEKYKKKFTFSPVNHEDSQVKMLLKNRLDFIIGYPFSYQYQLSYIDNLNVGLTFLRLKEKLSFTAGRSLCSNGPQGREIMQKINKCLHAEGFTQKALSSYLRYAPKQLKNEIRQKNLKKLN